jgi:Rrf2 family protein
MISRMKISAKTEYACIAMLELASRYGSGEPVRIRKIAERHDVPPRFLVQILLQLKGAGLVASTRGAAGGYHLLRSPETISLGEVMDVIEGSSDGNGEAKSSSASPESPAVKVLMKTWQDVAAVERDMLNGITFADLLEKAREQDEQMYYI